jgi:hypothetical protein
MCDYSGLDDTQRYSRKELTPEEINHHICNIIKVGRAEEWKLKIPMYENNNCLEVIFPPFLHFHFFVESIHILLQC